MKQLDQTLGAFHPVGVKLSLPSESLSLINEARAAFNRVAYPSTLVVQVVPESGCQECVLNYVEGLCVSHCNASTRADKTDIIYQPVENQE
jgi:hypothetical protein